MKGLHAEILVNAAAGGNFDESLERRLTEILSRAGATARITVASTVNEIAKLARAAASGDANLVVAGGGDGTVNLIASAVAGTGKIFGVLPLGTLNHFAKDLRIPLEFEAAAQNLLSGTTAEIDVAEVNGRIFLNNSSLGLYPTLVHEREKHERLGSGKGPAFVWAAIAAFRRYPFLNVRLEVEGKVLARRTPFVFVGNNEYAMELFSIGTRQRLNGGHLSLYITSRTGRAGLLRLALRALLGNLRGDKDFLALRAANITIDTTSGFARVALDGEVDVLRTPLEYRVRPKALKVIVPAAEEE